MGLVVFAIMPSLGGLPILPVDTPSGGSTFSDAAADLVFGQPGFTTSDSGTSATRLFKPEMQVFDAAGRLFVLDVQNHRILVYDNPLSDTSADTVIGQPNFTTGTAATTATGLSTPEALAFDSWGRLFVADRSNNRVLIFDRPAHDTTADTVIGQLNFTSSGSATTDSGLKSPGGLAFDPTGRLFVSDRSNRRILVFDQPAHDAKADTVIGQPDFASSASATTATGLSSPFGLAFDTAGRLFVADNGNHRVLVYDRPAHDTTADTVIGQANFTSSVAATTATGLTGPKGVAFDAAGRLFVGDQQNHRVLVFVNPTSDSTADFVLGQPNFTTGTAATSATGLSGPNGLAFDTGGRLFVADILNSRILVFNPDPLVGASPAAETSLPVSSVVTGTKNTTLSAPVATSESFVQVNLSGGDSTPGGAAALLAAAKADSTGAAFATADYVETWTLLNSGDTILMPLWTNQTSLRTFNGLRSDTGTLDGNLLPPGIPNTAAGKTAFGATVVLLEFADSTGRLLGDSKTTTNIGDFFCYSIRYLLSETTVARYRALGFDTAAGSASFRFYFADTYGGKWIEDTTVTVAVAAASAPWSLAVTVVGVTKDLPGGLGGVLSASASVPAKDDGLCLIQRVGTPGWMLAEFRSFRDFTMESFFGRFLAALYYALSGVA